VEEITFVLTSCDRPDLLEITLESFIKCNTYPIKKYFVIDDSGKPGCNDFLKASFPQVEFIYNQENIGQIKSIDRVYRMVETPWIFHCEEDWEFYRSGFIEESLNILNENPNVITVWLRAHSDTNNNPFSEEIFKAGKNTFFRVMRHDITNENGDLYKWHGFTFNPGLRRKFDWEKFGGYNKFQVTIEDKVIKNEEAGLSLFYALQGYIAVILSNDDRGYVKHTGWEKSTKLRNYRKG
jgi:GT2 family glycosyltransferase